METVKRGYEPEEILEFGLKAAGNHHLLSERQRLARMKHVVTSDAIILDKCESWYNLNRNLMAQAIPDAWIFQPN